MWLSLLPHVVENAKRYKYLINYGLRTKASSPNLVLSPASPRSVHPRRMGVLGCHRAAQPCCVSQLFIGLDRIVAAAAATNQSRLDRC